MTGDRRLHRRLGILLLLAMAAFASVGYVSIRRDVENLRLISQDNILWTATQMEVELLRFQLAVATFENEGTPEALDRLRERFDILWSRVSMIGTGRVGELIRRYDEGHGSIPAFKRYVEELDPVIAALAPGDTDALRAIRSDLEAFQQDLRLYTLRVVRGDTAAAAQVRDRIQYSSQTTIAISVAAVLLSALALALILRENQRQREIAALNKRIAAEAEATSRAKSRFLTMMSHELRNPLNGVLGPLALLRQSDLPTRQKRLVEQAQQSGQSMVQMLAGLLDYGEIQDGRFEVRSEPFRLRALAAGVADDLASVGAQAVRVTLAPDAPDVARGDGERLRRLFVHLVEHVLELAPAETVDLSFAHSGGALVGEIVFPAADASPDWRLDLMMGLTEVDPDQLSAEALRPLMARSLIAAARGVLSLADPAEGRRAIRVTVPAPNPRFERIRVRLETRSTAIAAIYAAALKSDRVEFLDAGAADPADLVLVDAASIGEEAVMARLRARDPDALFVSLGAPPSSEPFDEVVESVEDMTRLRAKVLGRLSA